MTLPREIFGAIRVEQRPFKLLVKASAGYEIRRYPAVVMIRTSMSEQQGSAFRTLANFIFGQGQAQPTPKPIAMTAPVITTTRKDDKEMAFFLPLTEYDSVDKVPEPASKDVRVEAANEQDLAVLGFTGVATDAVVVEKTELLKSMLRNDNVSFIDDGTVILNQYNPPWTIPILRTNEIAIPLIKTN